MSGLILSAAATRRAHPILLPSGNALIAQIACGAKIEGAGMPLSMVFSNLGNLDCRFLLFCFLFLVFFRSLYRSLFLFLYIHRILIGFQYPMVSLSIGYPSGLVTMWMGLGCVRICMFHLRRTTVDSRSRVDCVRGELGTGMRRSSASLNSSTTSLRTASSLISLTNRSVPILCFSLAGLQCLNHFRTNTNDFSGPYAMSPASINSWRAD